MSRAICSPYIEWAKLESSARFALAASGMPAVPLRELGATIDDVELVAPGGYGYRPLVERIATHCGVAPDCVVTATGTSMANYLAIAALVEPGDEVVVERPTYEPLLNAASFHGAAIARVDRRPHEGFRLDPDDLAKAVTSGTKLIVLANLHNPSSHFTDEATLRRIGDVAATVGARVLVDEVYLDAVFDQPVRSAFHLGPTFVATSSLTKVYGLSGLRCGWILAEPALAARLWRLNDLVANVFAFPAERLSLVAFDRIDALRERARGLLDRNRALLRAFLATRPELEADVPPYGTTACPRLRNGAVDRLCAVLRDRFETTVVPGRFFDVPDRFRVGICVDTEILMEGLRRLGLALDEM